MVPGEERSLEKYGPRRGEKSRRIWSLERREVKKNMVPGEERSLEEYGPRREEKYRELWSQERREV